MNVQELAKIVEHMLHDQEGLATDWEHLCQGDHMMVLRMAIRLDKTEWIQRHVLAYPSLLKEMSPTIWTTPLEIDVIMGTLTKRPSPTLWYEWHQHLETRARGGNGWRELYKKFVAHPVTAMILEPSEFEQSTLSPPDQQRKALWRARNEQWGAQVKGMIGNVACDCVAEKFFAEAEQMWGYTCDFTGEERGQLAKAMLYWFEEHAQMPTPEMLTPSFTNLTQELRLAMQADGHDNMPTPHLAKLANMIRTQQQLRDVTSQSSVPSKPKVM